MKHFQKKFTACAVIVFLISSTVVQAVGRLEKIAQSGVFKVGYSDASSPFSFPNKGDDDPAGYSVDICWKIVEAVKRETKRPDLNVKFVKVSYATRISEIVAGNIDIECGSTTNNAERRKQVAFTIPTFIDNSRLLVRKEGEIKSVRDLDGKKVVTTRGTTSTETLLALKTISPVSVLSETNDESFAIFDSGKADAFLDDESQLATMRAASKNKDNYILLNDILSIGQLAIMLPKDDPAFKKVVDIEVSRVILSGEINGIYKKWFESPIPPKQVNLNLPMGHLLRDSFKVPSDWVPN